MSYNTGVIFTALYNGLSDGFLDNAISKNKLVIRYQMKVNICVILYHMLSIMPCTSFNIELGQRVKESGV